MFGSRSVGQIYLLKNMLCTVLFQVFKMQWINADNNVDNKVECKSNQ